MESERITELRRLVSAAVNELRTAERLANEYAHNLHLSRTILAQRQQKLDEVIALESEETAARNV